MTIEELRTKLVDTTKEWANEEIKLYFNSKSFERRMNECIKFVYEKNLVNANPPPTEYDEQFMLKFLGHYSLETIGRIVESEGIKKFTRFFNQNYHVGFYEKVFTLIFLDSLVELEESKEFKEKYLNKYIPKLKKLVNKNRLKELEKDF